MRHRLLASLVALIATQAVAQVPTAQPAAKQRPAPDVPRLRAPQDGAPVGGSRSRASDPPQQNRAPSNTIFTQNGAYTVRLNDKVTIGGATSNSGDYVPGRTGPTTGDWLTDYQIGFQQPGAGYAVATSQLAVLNNDATQVGAAITAGARSRHLTGAATNIGVESFAVADNPRARHDTWSFYGEAWRVNNAKSVVTAAEFDTFTTSPSIAPDPYHQGDVIGLQLGSGAFFPRSGKNSPYGAFTQWDASAAIQLAANPKQFQVGINIFWDALAASNIAMAMPNGAKLQWSNASCDRQTQQCGAATTVGTISASARGGGTISVGRLPVFADNDTATAGGLIEGDLYRTAKGVLMVAY